MSVRDMLDAYRIEARMMGANYGDAERQHGEDDRQAVTPQLE